MQKYFFLSVIGLLLFFFELCTAEEQAVLDWHYEVTETGTALITAYTGEDSSVTVPETLDGYTVMGIADEAFSECEDLTEIRLPGTLNYIGRAAFGLPDGNLVFTVDENSCGAFWAQVNHYRYRYPGEPEKKSRITQLYESLLDEDGNPEKFHMSYRVDFLRSGTWYTCEASGTDGAVFKTLVNYGGEETVTKLYMNGMEYTLSPEEKTGTAVKAFPDTPGGGFFQEDELWKQLVRHAYRTDYAEHSRRMEGESFSAEVFPEDRYTSERAFYFGRDGELSYYYEDDYYGSNPSGRSDVLITVYVLDNSVELSLFDISDFEITELPEREPIRIP